MKPPFGYYGAKYRMASKIIPLIPIHTVYVEPFCGSCTILFSKKLPEVTNQDKYREVLNDTENNVINFFEVMRDNFDELNKMIEYSLYSQELHRRSHKIEDFKDKVERAYMFFINCNQSFCCNKNKGWGTGVYGGNKANSTKNKIDRFKEFKDRLQRCHISCEDALDCIKRWDSPHTFFYCDPPYPNTDQGSYSGYTEEDFYTLVETLDKCQGSFILSCYPMENMPKCWEKFEFSTTMSASGNTRRDKNIINTRDKKRTEVLWRRFNAIEPRSDIQKLYDSGLYDHFVKKNSYCV